MPTSLRLLGLVAIIPISLLLMISFFVLIAARKVDSKGLKTFGYVITALLWAGALIALSIGVYIAITGKHPLMEMMVQMMQAKSQMMHQMMNR